MPHPSTSCWPALLASNLLLELPFLAVVFTGSLWAHGELHPMSHVALSGMFGCNRQPWLGCFHVFKDGTLLDFAVGRLKGCGGRKSPDCTGKREEDGPPGENTVYSYLFFCIHFLNISQILLILKCLHAESGEVFFRWKKFIPINVKTFQIPIFHLLKQDVVKFVQKHLGPDAICFFWKCTVILFCWF